jgi:hypothetical protein
MSILVQKTIGDINPDPAQWVEIDVTSELSTTTINNYLTPSGITGTTFTVSLDDYNAGTIYDLNNYIDIPMNGETNKLNFGDEYYFYGNIDTDIQATIYEMKYAVNLTDTNFVDSSNPTFNLAVTKNTYITEIGLYNSDNDLMILSKMQYPVLRQGLQTFLIKYDF